MGHLCWTRRGTGKDGGRANRALRRSQTFLAICSPISTIWQQQGNIRLYFGTIWWSCSSIMRVVCAKGMMYCLTSSLCTSSFSTQTLHPSFLQGGLPTRASSAIGQTILQMEFDWFINLTSRKWDLFHVVTFFCDSLMQSNMKPSSNQAQIELTTLLARLLDRRNLNTTMWSPSTSTW